MTDDRIEEAIKRENAKLCIFDPIQAYLGGDTDMNRANEAREMTKKLGSIAERTGCAIVLIGHMNKGSGAKAAYRGIDVYKRQISHCSCQQKHEEKQRPLKWALRLVIS